MSLSTTVAAMKSDIQTSDLLPVVASVRLSVSERPAKRAVTCSRMKVCAHTSNRIADAKSVGDGAVVGELEGSHRAPPVVNLHSPAIGLH